jgi:hypothetical protein
MRVCRNSSPRRNNFRQSFLDFPYQKASLRGRTQQRWSLCRAIFLRFLRGGGLRLGRRTQDPLESGFRVDDGHGLARLRISGRGERGAQKLSGIGRRDFLVIPLQEAIGDGSHFWICSANFLDARVFLFYQVKEIRQFAFGRILKFEQSVQLAFFGRPKLQVDRASNARIVIIELAHFLSEIKRKLPNFSAVVWYESSDDELDNRLVGRKRDFSMKVGCYPIQAIEDSLADRFKVRSLEVGLRLGERGIQACNRRGNLTAKMRKFPVEAREFYLRGGREPVNRAKKHADAAGIKLNGHWGMSLRLDRIFDGGDDDRIFYDGDNDAASRKIGNNFLGGRSGDFLSSKRAGERPDNYENRESEKGYVKPRDAEERIE